MKFHGNIPEVNKNDPVGSEKLIADCKRLLEGNGLLVYLPVVKGCFINVHDFTR